MNRTPNEPAPDGLQEGRASEWGPRRVPRITGWFWVIKILTTALGEATSDFLVHQIDPVVAVALGALGLLLSLALQFSMRRYVPWVYWLAVAMVAVFGTMAADVVHIKLGVPYAASTAFFAVVLASVFVTWYASERSLSIHSIVTTRREAFYWVTVISTFALGTAAGDMAAITWHLGYLSAGLVFAAMMALPAAAYRWARLNEIVAFWAAYIVTRPLGASFADWVGKPHGARGLGMGDGVVSLVLTILIVGLVGYLTVTRRDVDGDLVEAPAY